MDKLNERVTLCAADITRKSTKVKLHHLMQKNLLLQTDLNYELNVHK